MRTTGILGVSCLAAAAALGACASTQPAPAAATSPAEILASDEALYEARCGVCHVAYHKGDFTPEEWPAIVEMMSSRSGLSASQRVRVLRWLQSP